ncbi:transposase [Paenibacillus polymyxa]|nr:transposase [Paenibacillus polymyxa]URJ58971.3 transposase [Paenibacillus polymyxa]
MSPATGGNGEKFHRSDRRTSSSKNRFKTLLEQYDMFARQLEEILAEVERLLSQIPGTKEMLTVPGVAVVTLAGFLAEVGNLRGYEHGQQIIRLAGLNLKENNSGKKKGKSSITKRGRARLRAPLWKMMTSLHDFSSARYVNG